MALYPNANENLNDLKPIKADDIHITLWKLSKDELARLKSGLPPGWELRLIEALPDLTIDPSVHIINRKATDDGSGRVTPAKRSAVVVVRQQTALRSLVDTIAGMVGLDINAYESNRPYHISIANLTGSPFDSVGDVTWCDLTNQPYEQAVYER